MTDVDTRRVYREDDEWVIEPGVLHSATFQDCLCIVTLLPPLPSAKERPVDMVALSKIFPKP
jgi:hypothetical protein